MAEIQILQISGDVNEFQAYLDEDLWIICQQISLDLRDEK